MKVLKVWTIGADCPIPNKTTDCTDCPFFCGLGGTSLGDTVVLCGWSKKQEAKMDEKHPGWRDKWLDKDGNYTVDYTNTNK